MIQQARYVSLHSLRYGCTGLSFSGHGNRNDRDRYRRVRNVYLGAEPYMLALGSGMHPVQWLTSNVFHADIFHLVFNMLFFWVFGPIIEGRIGAFKMLAIYMGTHR